MLVRVAEATLLLSSCSSCLWSREARGVSECNCVAAGLLCSLGMPWLLMLRVWNPPHQHATMWFQEASPSDRRFLVWGYGLFKKKTNNAKSTVNLAKGKFGGSDISAEVRYIGVFILIYTGASNAGVLNTTLTLRTEARKKWLVLLE